MIGMYVGAIPGECASSGWPDEWIEEFEEDPEKVMDEKETAIFYQTLISITYQLKWTGRPA